MRTINTLGAIPNDHWLRGFHERLISEDLSPVTVRGYLYRSWLTEIHGREPALEQLPTVDVAAYRQHLVDVKRLKASSVNRRIQAVKKLFSWAHTGRLIRVPRIFARKCTLRNQTKASPSFHPTHIHHTG